MKNFFNKVKKSAADAKGNLIKAFEDAKKADLKPKDAIGIAKQTYKEVTSSKEKAAAFAASAFMPGGLPLYLGYQCKKYIDEKNGGEASSNDNQEQEQPKKALGNKPKNNPPKP